MVVASTRASRGLYPRSDRSADRTVADRTWLRRHRTHRRRRRRTRRRGDPTAIFEQADLVITTGGTGLSPTDRTPNTPDRCSIVEIPGLADAIRPRALAADGDAFARSLDRRPPSQNLPGSTGGAVDGLAVLWMVGCSDHALDQIAGGTTDRRRQHPTAGGGTWTAGGDHGPEICTQVRDTPISQHEHEGRVMDCRIAAGAIIGFGGIVRNRRRPR